MAIPTGLNRDASIQATAVDEILTALDDLPHPGGGETAERELELLRDLRDETGELLALLDIG